MAQPRRVGEQAEVRQTEVGGQAQVPFSCLPTFDAKAGAVEPRRCHARRKQTENGQYPIGSSPA